MSQKLEWTKTPMMGWTKYTAVAGDVVYTIEKDDTRIFALWKDSENLAVVSSVQSAKKAAQDDFNNAK